LAWKTDGISTAVAEAINGNPPTRKNLLYLVTIALNQMTAGTSPTAPLLLESALILIYNIVYNRPSEGPGVITLQNLKEMLQTLEYIFLNPNVGPQTPKSYIITGKIYRDLFMKVPIPEVRYSVVELMLNTTVCLINRWLDILRTTDKPDVKKSIIDLLVGYLYYGNQSHKQLIADCGIVGQLRSLLLLNNDEISSKVVDLVGALAYADQTYMIIAFVISETDILSMMLDCVARVDGPLIPDRNENSDYDQLQQQHRQLPPAPSPAGEFPQKFQE